MRFRLPSPVLMAIFLFVVVIIAFPPTTQAQTFAVL